MMILMGNNIYTPENKNDNNDIHDNNIYDNGSDNSYNNDDSELF